MTDLATTRQQIEERRAKRAKAIEEARETQYTADLVAIEALEIASDPPITIDVSHTVRQYVPGCPVIVGMRPPTEAEYKRFFSQINRANGNGDAKVAAQVQLAQACWVYPADHEQRKAMLSANAGMLASIGNAVNKQAELQEAAEGKD